MTKKFRITVRNDEMPLTLLHDNASGEFCCIRPGGIHHDATCDFLTIVEPNTALRYLHHRTAQLELGPALLCAADEETSGTRWIQDCISGNQQSPGQTIP